MEPLTPPGPARAPRVAVVIPTLNEEESIAVAVGGVPRGAAETVIVVDGFSTDRTVERAEAAGARVVRETRRGYGRACLGGALAAEHAEIIVFMDGDGSDRADLIPDLVAPILAGDHDFVIASRTRGEREPGSMAGHQVAAGLIAGWVTRLLYGVRYTDMCAFRAIRRDVLLGLGMREEAYGWNLEMQMRVARKGLRVLEVPVPYRRRVGGASKVAGSLGGTLKAGRQIAAAMARVAVRRD